MENNNLKIYNAVRAVPNEAIRPITAGRLKGKSDINPMWRIKALTEQFGPCGIGWGYTIDKQWMEEGNGGEIAAFCNISLWVKVDGVKSEPIPGTGGSAFVAKEKNGLYTSDECYKMALTDAISVACKALGFAADVYWQSDRTKYERGDATDTNVGRKQAPTPIICQDCGQPILPVTDGKGQLWPAEVIAAQTQQAYGKPVCWTCSGKRKAAMQAAAQAAQTEEGF